MKFIVYVAILLVAAAGLALGLDLLTAPPKKLEANAPKPASAAVRQIPIKEATAQQNGDPANQLTPIYPAAPGKDLPVKDTPMQAAAKEPPKPAQAAAPQTSGSAPAREAATAAVPRAAPVSGPTAGIVSAGACNIDACTAAYRSFRAADCSYQPFEGERKFCDAGQAQPAQAAVPPPPPPKPSTQASAPPPPARREQTAPIQNSQNSKSQDQRDLEAAVRTVRSLPPQDARDDGRDVVVEEPAYGDPYGSPRRRWIIERR
jgi:hypothetical protein